MSPGKEAGKAKPLKAPKKGAKDYDDNDLEFLKKKKEEEKALKEARDKMKGKNGGGNGGGGGGDDSGSGGGGNSSACRVCDLARSLLAAAGLAAPTRVSGAPSGPSAAATAAAALPPPPPPLPAPPPGAGGARGTKPEEGLPPRPADCLGCRLTGLIAGLGGAGYLSSALLNDPPPRGAHRGALLASSALLAALGVARGAGWY